MLAVHATNTAATYDWFPGSGDPTCPAPVGRECRRRVYVPDSYVNTTNFVSLVTDIVLTRSPVTLELAQSAGIQFQARSVADEAAKVVAADFSDVTGARGAWARDKCVALVRELAAWIHNVPAVRYAGFWDDEDQVATLVIHDGRWKRQLSYEFGPGAVLRCVKIDEHLTRTVVAMSVSDLDEARRELIECLRG